MCGGSTSHTHSCYLCEGSLEFTHAFACQGRSHEAETVVPQACANCVLQLEEGKKYCFMDPKAPGFRHVNVRDTRESFGHFPQGWETISLNAITMPKQECPRCASEERNAAGRIVRYRCGVPNCSRAQGFDRRYHLNVHRYNIHGLLPAEGESALIFCDVPGCEHKTAFGSRYKLNVHRNNVHGLLPAEGESALIFCHVPGCEHKKAFKSRLELTEHQASAHKIVPREARPAGVPQIIPHPSPAVSVDIIVEEECQLIGNILLAEETFSLEGLRLSVAKRFGVVFKRKKFTRLLGHMLKCNIVYGDQATGRYSLARYFREIAEHGPDEQKKRKPEDPSVADSGKNELAPPPEKRNKKD